MVTTIVTAMAAYSNARVAAIVLDVLYRMLTVNIIIPTFICLDFLNNPLQNQAR